MVHHDSLQYTVYNNFDIIRYQGTTYDKQGNFYDTNYKVLIFNKI